MCCLPDSIGRIGFSASVRHSDGLLHVRQGCVGVQVESNNGAVAKRQQSNPSCSAVDSHSIDSHCDEIEHQSEVGFHHTTG